MKQRLAPAALLAVGLLAAAGCTSGGDGDSSITPSPSATASPSPTAEPSGSPSPGSPSPNAASPDSDAGATEGVAGDAGGSAPASDRPTATVSWGSQSQQFVLVLCDGDGSSLTASGDDIASRNILTIGVAGGTGQVLIADDVTLDETFIGSVDAFAMDGPAFQGSGDYQSGDQSGTFTFRGDCQDL